ncbi:MAG: hypothetical protein JNJ41_02530 [Bacteroidia bacterium]|nr:hypothetical protein [Bacteroidia bacterium]
MEDINRIFKNAINEMSKSQLMPYLFSKLKHWEMKQALLNIDEGRKMMILEEEMDLAMTEILAELEKLNMSDEEKRLKDQKETELLKLEGRILLLLLTMKLAKQTKDNKLLFETDQKFKDLVFEYRDSGGKKEFYKE